jgi:hypothetical protein
LSITTFTLRKIKMNMNEFQGRCCVKSIEFPETVVDSGLLIRTFTSLVSALTDKVDERVASVDHTVHRSQSSNGFIAHHHLGTKEK